MSACLDVYANYEEWKALIGRAEYTCFANSCVCCAGVVAGGQQEARAFGVTVLFTHTGVTHGYPLLWRHRDVTSCAAVRRQHWWEMKSTGGEKQHLLIWDTDQLETEVRGQSQDKNRTKTGLNE